MRNALASFEMRKREVGKYLDFLLLTHKTSLRMSVRQRSGRVDSPMDGDTKIILRANAFLMFYNLIESTIQDCIEAIYASILVDGLTYVDVREEIQGLWLRFTYRDVEKQRATHDKYMEIAKKLVDDIVNATVIDIDSDYKMGLSGNLDAKRIREIASIYGFQHSVRKRARGGQVLRTIKENRNGLAHGNMSFVECGRLYSVEDINKIKREVIYYLEDILRNVGQYVHAREYASPQWRARLAGSASP